MHFQHSERSKELQERISHFMDEHIFPSEEIFSQQMEEFAKQDDRWQIPQIIEDKKKIRSEKCIICNKPADYFVYIAKSY